MIRYIPKNVGPAVIKAANSNTISDTYRDTITISYQFLNNVPANSEFELFGEHYDMPIFAGPIGLHGKQYSEDVLVEYARAVNAAGSLFFSHYHAKDSWYKLLAEGCRAVRVIKPLADMELLLEEIRKDTECGAKGYAMDIDHGITVYGENDEQQGLTFKSRTADELKRINDASPLPFYVKSVISVHDALIAKEAGVAGIILSGHNNRFPCAVPPLRMLPTIREAVGPEMKIFIDGGLNNGYDAFKALALGADAVLTARAAAGAFAKDGEAGLTEKLVEMNAELLGAMSNTGSPDLAHINRASIILP